jgi:hypothetical protein
VAGTGGSLDSALGWSMRTSRRRVVV